MADQGLQEQLRRHVDALPLLPTVVAGLLRLDAEDPEYFEHVRDLVEGDPTFAARLIAASNAVAVAGREPVTSVPRAMMRLGSTGCADLILALAVSRVFIPNDPWEKGLWRHAIQVAHAARAAARHLVDLGVDPDEAYTAGLLHDIGRFVMFQLAPDDLRRVDEAAWTDAEEMLEVERSVCGLTHGEIGELAIRHWRLPDRIAEVVARHHQVDLDLPTPLDHLVGIVHLADLSAFDAMKSDATPADDAVDRVRATASALSHSTGVEAADTLLSAVQQTRSLADETSRALGLG